VNPARYLADTSALARLLTRPKGTYLDAWDELVETGLVAVCPITELEFLYSARSRSHRDEWATILHTLFCYAVVDDRSYDRALDVQRQLTDRGLHRGPGAVDLLVAATAELQGLVLLHCDNDFDTAAAVTGQPVERLRPSGR
jgi:predicted nucleic acid-binding protein